MKKLIFVAVIGLFLASCSTTHSTNTLSSSFRAKTNHMSSGKARITFVRNRNNQKVPIITAVSIDDWVVATLGPGEQTTLEVESGLRHVGLKGKSTPMTLKPEREYFFYIELNSEGNHYELHSILESKTKEMLKS